MLVVLETVKIVSNYITQIGLAVRITYGVSIMTI